MLFSTSADDRVWFDQFPRRQARIRHPALGEAKAEFATLGPHDPDRRRMIIVRVPDGHFKGQLMPIPFLAFADEEIANEDAVIMPIVDQIMKGEKAGG